MKRVLITGANGFIGSHLTNCLLDNGIKVIAVVRNKHSDISLLKNCDNLTIVYCNLDNIFHIENIVNNINIDVFYHLAWSGSSGKDRSNYRMQLQNVEYACDCAIFARRLNCKKFICVGTITEKLSENIFNNNIKSENMLYGIAKHATHCMLDVLCNDIGINFIWARLSNIYGINDKTGNIVSYTIGQLSSGKIPEFSKAEQPYDLMYVKDTARALYLLGEKNVSKKSYFVGSGKPRILKEYLNSIKDVFGHDGKINIGKKQEDGLIYLRDWFDTNDLVNETGFQVKNNFEDNIREIVNKIN